MEPESTVMGWGGHVVTHPTVGGHGGAEQLQIKIHNRTQEHPAGLPPLVG